MASMLPTQAKDPLSGNTGPVQLEYEASWDDQPAQAAEIYDLREASVREFLHDVRSPLRGWRDALAIYRRMGITARVSNHEAPRNIGLLFFSDDPRRWFPGASIATVQFAADRAGDVLVEHAFRGPLPGQIRNCLRYLEGLAHSHLRKRPNHPRAWRWASYPLSALREAIVNAVCHRAYRPNVMEPTKVCVYADRIEVISYPGPVSGLEPHHFAGPHRSLPPVVVRNPRVAEFLRSLGLAEGRRTGTSRMYRAMADNGSPEPRFDFDQGWFRTTLPVHPAHAAVSASQVQNAAT